ncbi:hypothetical protein ACV3OO_11390 [Clostridium perfringens]
MVITQELRERLLKYRLGRNILIQALDGDETIYDLKDIKIMVNDKEIKNPIEYIEEVDSLIEKAIDNFDEEVDKAAKELIKEKYEDFYNESLELSRRIEELQNDISWRMDNR